jgi:hypothetical protein
MICPSPRSESDKAAMNRIFGQTDKPGVRIGRDGAVRASHLRGPELPQYSAIRAAGGSPDGSVDPSGDLSEVDREFLQWLLSKPQDVRESAYGYVKALVEAVAK